MTPISRDKTECRHGAPTLTQSITWSLHFRHSHCTRQLATAHERRRKWRNGRRIIITSQMEIIYDVDAYFMPLAYSEWRGKIGRAAKPFVSYSQKMNSNPTAPRRKVTLAAVVHWHIYHIQQCTPLGELRMCRAVYLTRPLRIRLKPFRKMGNRTGRVMITNLCPIKMVFSLTALFIAEKTLKPIISVLKQIVWVGADS